MRVGILGHKGQEALLPAAALGDVMLLQERVLAVEGDGVKVQIEGLAPGQAQLTGGIKPAVHELGVRGRINPATVFGEERAFGDAIEAREQGQAGVEHFAHHMAVASRAIQFKSQQGAHGVRGGDLLGAGELALLQDTVPGHGAQVGHEQEQAAKLGAELAGGQVQQAGIGDRGGFRMGVGGPLFIGPSWQAGKTFFLEDVGDGNRAEPMTLLLQEPADVVNGEVLLAGLDNLEAPGVGFGGAVGSFGRRQKERAVRILAELAGQDAETAGRIAEAAGGFLGRETLDVEGAQGLVLAVGGVGRG